MKQNDWHEGFRTCSGYPTVRDLVWLVQDVDVVLVAETPLNYKLFEIARNYGVKSVCVPNYEFFDYFLNPEYAKPDVIISPSMWHYYELDEWAKKWGVEHEYIHHPVDRDEFKFKLRTGHSTLHLAGNPASHDRNGTWTYLDTIPDGTIITQSESLKRQITQRYRHCRVLDKVKDSKDIYTYGDILVYPRKYGGNSLPLNEALSSGMPVIMPDIAPNNYLLPKEWLVPAQKTGEFTPRTKIDIYDVRPQDLIERINYVRANIEEESKKANVIADKISWETLKPKWDKICS
jgi:hypothetical protein